MDLEGSKINYGPSLENLVISVPKFATPEDRDVKEEVTRKAVFNGVPVRVVVSSKSYFEKKVNQMPLVEVLIIVSMKTEIDVNAASVSIVVNKDRDGECKATTKIENTNRELKGLGRTLWEVALQLIQQFADKLTSPVTHRVNILTTHGLSDQKWHELFSPLLEKHGYKQKYNNLWERTYLPNKK